MTDQQKTCMDCPHHLVINDPDPNDWFCDDDKAVVCKLKDNDKQDTQSKYLSDRHPNKVVEPSIRPYKLREEAIVPEWCPIKDQENGMDK